ncbi:hypothetical protein BT63DRAFT_414963 [Microthyrium microscopicum]|uniref:Uncharacterized protein n=1 Tax=Microthyrium microscopicum TaxID=703497 RepID=A0A6A6U915_9PEZI|nr:hypothetical protein BT63DRAFT_414963 [Microthyrium microscopicum]
MHEDSAMNNLLTTLQDALRDCPLLLYAPMKTNPHLCRLANDYAARNGMHSFQSIYKALMDAKIASPMFLSEALAQCASGTVYLYLPHCGLERPGIFTKSEWPELMSNENVEKIVWIRTDDSLCATGGRHLTIWIRGQGATEFPLGKSMWLIQHEFASSNEVFSTYAGV